jgi:hypothetical protein
MSESGYTAVNCRMSKGETLPFPNSAAPDVEAVDHDVGDADSLKDLQSAEETLGIWF